MGPSLLELSVGGIDALKHVEAALWQVGRQPKCQARQVLHLHKLTVDLDEVNEVLLARVIV